MDRAFNRGNLMIPEFVLNPDLTRQIINKPPHEKIRFSDGDSERAYLSELWRMHLLMEQLLIDEGFISSRDPHADETDFFINDDIGRYRRINFAITNPRMISQGILETIYDFLHQLNDRYDVVILGDFDSADLELFMIVVTREKVYGAFETARMASRFGFDPSTGVIKAFSPGGLKDDFD
jgi:hypothetical protein